MLAKEAEENWAKPKTLPRSLDLYSKTQNLTADNTDDTDFTD